MQKCLLLYSKDEMDILFTSDEVRNKGILFLGAAFSKLT